MKILRVLGALLWAVTVYGAWVVGLFLGFYLVAFHDTQWWCTPAVIVLAVMTVSSLYVTVMDVIFD